jgi:hypothetical protein
MMLLREDIRHWIRAIGLTACAVGLGLYMSGRIKPTPDATLSSLPAYKAALATGLFQEPGLYICLTGVALFLLSLIRIGKSRS